MPSVRRFIPALAAFGALVAAAPAAASIREIGVDGATPLPKPGCPTQCEAVGQVTGYQVQIGKAKNPYLIHRKGKIVAFTVALGKPNAKQMQFFQNLYGPKPQVRLSILKLGRRNREATLTSQSGVWNVAPYFGSSPTFALSKALPVGPRSVVALTVPTWAPVFAVKLGQDMAWRSSRSSNACGDVQQNAAHQTLNSVRSYGCFYRTARLTYSASFVANPKPTTPPKKK
jgi:hypothetical protein